MAASVKVTSTGKTKPKMKYQTKASVALDRSRGYKGGETDVNEPVEKKTILNPIAEIDPKSRSAITVNGVDMSRDEYAQLNKTKQTGVAPLNPNLSRLFIENQKETQARADELLVRGTIQKERENQLIQQTQQKIDQEKIAQTPQVQVPQEIRELPTGITQGVESNIPEINPGVSGVGTFIKEYYGKSLFNSIQKVLSGKISSGVGSFVGTALTPRTNYASLKTSEAETDFKIATDQLDNVIAMAKVGMPEEVVRDQWLEAVNTLSMIDSNLQRLSKIDENYYQTTGKELKAKLELIRVSLPQKQKILNEVFIKRVPEVIPTQND